MKILYKILFFTIGIVVFFACNNDKDKVSQGEQNLLANDDIDLKYPGISLSDFYFSTAGSYLLISELEGSKTGRLLLKTSSSRPVSTKIYDFWAHDFFILTLLHNGEEVPFTAKCTPWCLTMQNEFGSARITFQDTNTLLFNTTGVTLRFIPKQPATWMYKPESNQYAIFYRNARRIFYFKTVNDDSLQFKEEYRNSNPRSFNQYFTIDQVSTGKQSTFALKVSDQQVRFDASIPVFDSVVASSRSELDTWMNKMPELPDDYRELGEKAWYAMWVNRVGASLMVDRDMLYISKELYNKLWGWECSIQALCLAKADPMFAWDQVMFFLDHQSETGQIPDNVNDLDFSIGITKPPLYGYVMNEILDDVSPFLDHPELVKAFRKLEKSTIWWFHYMDMDKDGFCEYLNGKDSGWDFASLFDARAPVEAVDLTGYLINQMYALSNMAGKIYLPDEQLKWKDKADSLLLKFIDYKTTGEVFHSTTVNNKVLEHGSLIDYSPLILGNRLPENLVNQMVKNIMDTNKYYSPVGLVTESLSSPDFDPRETWRGTIYPPVIYIMFKGMVRCGRMDEARKIAIDYCELCKNAHGFYQHYNYQNSTEIQSINYSTGAAVFTMLANWLNENQ